MYEAFSNVSKRSLSFILNHMRSTMKRLPKRKVSKTTTLKIHKFMAVEKRPGTLIIVLLVEFSTLR